MLIAEGKKRINIRKLPPEERIKDFSEVELGFTEEEAQAEARRCLTCNVGVCVGCKICAEVCPNSAITIISMYDEEHQRFVRDYYLDLAKCLYCGFCAEACPTSCLHLGKIYELAGYNRDDFICDMKDLQISGQKEEKKN